jgi:hypothetical protein
MMLKTLFNFAVLLTVSAETLELFGRCSTVTEKVRQVVILLLTYLRTSFLSDLPFISLQLIITDKLN